jgi:hypothetical protein
MHHPAWNPVRRNRHIGTAVQGHGADNRLVIPENWSRDEDRYIRFYEQIKDYRVVQCQVGLRDLPLLVEAPQPGWFYPCTPADIAGMLALYPESDRRSLDLLILRQPTRKQRILRPVWGRAIFKFQHPRYTGTAIFLEAQNLEPSRWPRSLSTQNQQERARLLEDGHKEYLSRRHIEFQPTPASLRNTLLYRTLLHELGHLVDYATRGTGDYCNRPYREREDFAHRYATETIARLRESGLVPFPHRIDPEQLQQDGLEPAWFLPAIK